MCILKIIVFVHKFVDFLFFPLSEIRMKKIDPISQEKDSPEENHPYALWSFHLESVSVPVFIKDNAGDDKVTQNQIVKIFDIFYPLLGFQILKVVIVFH